MPPRKPKANKLFEQPEAAEVDSSHEVTKSPVNIKKLKALVWKGSLEEMQEAVAEIQGADDLTMQAVDGALKSTNTGFAAQYLQQIIQRNS